MKAATQNVSTEHGNGPAAHADESVSRWSALMSVLANWRDWNLPVKLAAVTLVPVVFAIVLGTMQISDQVDEANSYRRVDRLVAVNEELRGLVGALQVERGAAGVLLAGRTADVVPQLADEQRDTDATRAAFMRAAGRVTFGHEAAADRYADVERWLGELADIREQVAAPGFDAGNAVIRYSAVVDTLLRFDRTMASEAIDPTLASTASALYDLEEIKKEVSYQHAVIAVGISRGVLTGPEVDALTASVGRQADRLADFYSLAAEDRRDLYDATVAGTGIAARNNIVAAVVADPHGGPLPTTAQAWEDGSVLTANRIGDVASVLGADLRDRSAALQDEASDGAGLAAVILLVALVVAVAVMVVVGRHLLSSLAALRNGALDVAERALPAAVARIRDRGEQAGDIELPPVPVTSMDEVGQVARAFDAVQRQALLLATEQAGLRATYASVFVNLSRRSQGLVQRQLQLLERLERDEEDSDQLATLFQLDHLATRMRRNNENLMVLSGSDGGRRAQRPTGLADLLRASVSEIEQYQRVVLLPPPSVQVVGYAVGDLVRLVAELLDNATAFSAPDTQVTIASHSFEDGSVCIAVLDEGIGMNQAELDEANAKLADSGLIDVATARRMGLFVIGRLAGRHGIEVWLNGGHGVKGVQATVTVPADVIAPSDVPVGPERVKALSNGAGLLTPFSPAGERPTANGVNGRHTNGHVNGSTNGHANGNANGLANGFANGHTNGANRITPLPRRAQPEPVPETPQQAADAEAPPQEELSGEGHMPLPRRSPGGMLPGQRGAGPAEDEIAGPHDTLEPSTGESGAGLFSPAAEHAQDDDGWGAEGTPVDRASVEETTPIFDEMVSAWFRAMSDPAVDARTAAAMMPQLPGKDPQSGGEVWNFATDSGFDAARAVLEAEPSDYTSSGLPRRSPRQNLVPGSAVSGAADEPPRYGRDADDLRSRLSGYRQGVRRARDHRGGAEPPSSSAAPVIPPPPQAPDAEPADAETARLDLTGAGWRFAADFGWQTANEVSSSTPVDFTSGGLPRRSPRQNLVPGSVSPSGSGTGTSTGGGVGNGAVPPMADRAEEMRGRLGNFQMGLYRGRKRLADRTSANGFHNGQGLDHKQQQESE
ncbi:MAG: nitrate- and nitrite sensing domain-containing protein [Actinophytocola sp.]|uniref:sensor histidine kinase n=1 Tax=Actinophytocola sp. TaxID=1872138 RepID=UPI003C757157